MSMCSKTKDQRRLGLEGSERGGIRATGAREKRSGEEGQDKRLGWPPSVRYLHLSLCWRKASLKGPLKSRLEVMRLQRRYGSPASKRSVNSTRGSERVQRPSSLHARRGIKAERQVSDISKERGSMVFYRGREGRHISESVVRGFNGRKRKGTFSLYCLFKVYAKNGTFEYCRRRKGSKERSYDSFHRGIEEVFLFLACGGGGW